MMSPTQSSARKTNTEPYPTSLHIPTDLLPIILCNLPVKSLLRFRCVSKSWLALVDDDPNFARSHLDNFKNNRNESRLFVFRGSSGFREVTCAVRRSDTFNPIPDSIFIFSKDEWLVVTSVDGLILLKSIFNENHLMVWNPSIKKCRDIPPLVHQIKGDVSGEDFGFGYDPLSNDYKLVRIVLVNEIVHSVAIYSLGADSWRMIKFQCKGCSSSTRHWAIWQHSKRVCLQGSLYLIVQEEKMWNVVSFDLSKEMFSYVNTPPFMRQKEFILINDGCSLAMFDIFSLHKSMWVLDWESMSWKKRCSYSALGDALILCFKKNSFVLTLVKTEETVVDENGKEKLVRYDEVRSYNPERDEYSILQRQPETTNLLRYIWDVSVHIETLILA